MKKILLKHWTKIAGVALGSLGGYLYYHFVGCVSGTCPITSNPYNMILYGAVLGFLVFEMFNKEDKVKRVNEISESNENIDINKRR